MFSFEIKQQTFSLIVSTNYFSLVCYEYSHGYFFLHKEASKLPELITVQGKMYNVHVQCTTATQQKIFM